MHLTEIHKVRDKRKLYQNTGSFNTFHYTITLGVKAEKEKKEKTQEIFKRIHP